jgi:hypothetical protein
MNSIHFAGKKETFAFAPRKPIFDEKHVRKKKSKKKKARKPKPTEEKEEPDKISRSQGHGARRKNHRRLILRTSLKKIRKKSSHIRKKNPPRKEEQP